MFAPIYGEGKMAVLTSTKPLEMVALGERAAGPDTIGPSDTRQDVQTLLLVSALNTDFYSRQLTEARSDTATHFGLLDLQVATMATIRSGTLTESCSSTSVAQPRVCIIGLFSLVST